MGRSTVCRPALLLEIIDEKLSRSSLTVAQRIYWLAAGVVVAPHIYLDPLESFVGAKSDRIRKMATFFAHDEDLPLLVDDLDARTLRFLINRMGCIYQPIMASGRITAEMRAADHINRLIHRLSSLPTDDASLALEELATDEVLSKWRLVLERARDRQRVINRDAGYQHPSIEQVRRDSQKRIPGQRRRPGRSLGGSTAFARLPDPQ